MLPLSEMGVVGLWLPGDAQVVEDKIDSVKEGQRVLGDIGLITEAPKPRLSISGTL